MNFQIPGIDADKVYDLYDDDDDLYAAVLRSCAENTPEVLNKLKDIADRLKDNGQDALLADYALNIHGIKGTCGTIGAEDLRKESIELETFAKAGDKANLLARHDAFLKRANELLDYIKKFINHEPH